MSQMFKAILTFSILLGGTAMAASSPVMDLAQKLDGPFLINSLPKGYSAEKIDNSTNPAPVEDLLNERIAAARTTWADHVDTSPSFEDLSTEEKNEIKNDPIKYLRIRSILTVNQQFKIYHNRQFIGFAIDVTDHVQSAIFEDGAGFVIYLDKGANVVAVNDWAG